MPALPLPLRGVRVVDASQFVAGPYAARCPAALGADVIKVERPPTGDLGRVMPYSLRGQSGYYLQQNMGKKGLCVDLKDQRGRELARKLAARADVLVENFRPGVLDRLGLGYADLEAPNPGHPVLGRTELPGVPIRFAEGPLALGRAPLLGEHNRQIARELGYADPDIAALERAGVLHSDATPPTES